MAPLEPRIIEKGLASDAVVIDTVVAKYCDHLPLYRQAAILEREAGLEIGAGNAGWLGDAGRRITASRDRSDAQGSADGNATCRPTKPRFRCRCTTAAAAITKAYLWQYGKPGGETVFDFCLGRGREGPRKFLGKWEGILQTDGYQAYEGVGGPKMVHVGCWAHARRKFVDAVKVQSARR